jgi:NodT family efflux transporter outer membrane factor (OMF) lipoprotein
MRVRGFWTAAAAAASLSGCAVGADYTAPVVATPTTFLAQTSTGSRREPAIDEVDIRQWWRSLQDKELDSLIDRAMTSNLDLKIALTRVQEAREHVLGTGAELFPRVDVVAGGGGGTGSDNTNGRLPSDFRAGENARNLSKISEASGLDMGWDLDLLGKIKHEVEAEKDDAEALEHARDFVYVTVVANVARAYVDLRALQRELAVLGENIDAARTARGLAQSRLDQGLTDALDVALARRQLATLEAERGPLIGRIETSRNAIATLLGRFPESMTRELSRSDGIPRLPARIPIGLPSQLLRRRPDIAEIERRLAAANARVGEAIADLFPDVSITGAFGQQAGPQSSSAKPAFAIWTIGPSMTTPFLDFGELDARIAVADLVTREVLVTYREAILAAVRQVDDAAAVYHTQQERLADLDLALKAAREATGIATERYNRGLTDFLNVLDAERAQFDLEQRYVEAQQVEADALVALFEALGGGWPAHTVLPPIHQPEMAAVAAVKYLSGEPAKP